MTYSIAQLPQHERPRERFLSVGPESMATSELIAILLGSGIQGKSVIDLSRELVAHFGGLDKLAEATLEEIGEVKGMGPAKAIQLKASLTLAQRLSRESMPSRPLVRSPLHAYLLLKDGLENETREFFQLLLLDIRGRHLRTETVSVGTISQTLVHPREVFYPAIRHKAASMVVAHNHPSGDPEPSKQDVALTRRLVESGEIIGIAVEDHLIIGKECYVSLRERGLFETSK